MISSFDFATTHPIARIMVVVGIAAVILGSPANADRVSVAVPRVVTGVVTNQTQIVSETDAGILGKSAMQASMPARLAAYRTAFESAYSAQKRLDKANEAVDYLAGISESAFLTKYPGGDFAATKVAYGAAQIEANHDHAKAEAVRLIALAEVTGGRDMTPEALAELHSMLGL